MANDFQIWLINQGYYRKEGSPIYVVFNSNQIKSVENDGTWDIADDNIFS